ncbi:MAG: tail fiber protein [Chloroflexota bacterium]|nr:tail fiber protein [Chloroflexota bacterium]
MSPRRILPFLPLCALTLLGAFWFWQPAHAQTQQGTTFGLGWLLPYITLAAPQDCLPATGGSYLRTDYPALYAALDTAFVIDADNFRVPDLRGRSPIGAGTGTNLSARAVNEVGGAETHLLTANEMPAHVHDTAGGGVQFAQINVQQGGTSAFLLAQFPAGFELTTGLAGQGQAHNNMMPFVALNWCIVAKSITIPTGSGGGGGSVGVPGDPVVKSTLGDQTVAFDFTTTAGDVHIANLLTLGILSSWGFFFFNIFATPMMKKAVTAK